MLRLSVHWYIHISEQLAHFLRSSNNRCKLGGVEPPSLCGVCLFQLRLYCSLTVVRQHSHDSLLPAKCFIAVWACVGLSFLAAPDEGRGKPDAVGEGGGGGQSGPSSRRPAARCERGICKSSQVCIWDRSPVLLPLDTPSPHTHTHTHTRARTHIHTLYRDGPVVSHDN